MTDEEWPTVLGHLLNVVIGLTEAVYCGLRLVLYDSDSYCQPGSDHCCPICFEEMVPNVSFFPSYLVGHTATSDKILFFPNFIDEMSSNHVFHEYCLKKCLMRDPELPTCPLCRKIIFDNRDVAFDVFCRLNEKFDDNVEIPSLDSLLAECSHQDRAIAIEQYFLHVMATKNTGLLLKNFMTLNKLIPNFEQYHRYFWNIFSFDKADLSGFLEWPLEMQFAFLHASYSHEKFDTFCRLFDNLGCPAKSKEPFLVDLIVEEVSNPVKAEYKLVLLFDRLSPAKKLQIQSKLFGIAIKHKNIEFIIKFSLFYDNYPENYNALLRSFIMKNVDYLFVNCKQNVFELYNLLSREYADINTLLLLKALEHDQFRIVENLFSSPRLTSFSGTADELVAKIIKLTHSNGEDVLKLLRGRNFKFIPKRSICTIV